MGIRPAARLLAVAIVLLLARAATAAEPDLTRPLPVDPNVHMVELENGLRVWIRRHATPPERVGIWLHVSTGSINEEEDERGLAHFLEHLAFNGSEHFPPGELVKYFESIGLTFGTHQNAFTGFDQTVYTLTLPDTDDATVSKGLLCMADYAFRLLLLPEEIEKERRVVLEEVRARKGARQRIMEELLPILLPESRAGRRLPIGREEAIAALSREDFVRYYRRWYRPDNATLLIVGDRDPAELAALAREQFAEWPAVEDAPPNADPGVEPYDEIRAAVITDPELTTSDPSVVAVRPLEPMQTVGDFRRELVDELGLWIVDRRLDEMVQKGTAPFQRARLHKFPLWNVCTYVEAEAVGPPDRSGEMMRSVLVELKRAREHGFLEQEFADARKALLAAAEQAARTEPTWDAETFLGAMNDAVARERKPISQAQRLGLLTELIDGVTLAEVEAAFRRNFDPEARLLLVTMPGKEDVEPPAEADLLALAEEAEAVAVEPPAEKERPESLLAREPEPGEVIEREEEPDLEILSVTLGNGVRAHLRSMDFKKDEVLVRVTLGGGELRETAANRGLTDVATLAFRQPAGGGLTSTQVRDLLTGKNVSLGVGQGRDYVRLELSGTPDDIEEGFRLVHLLLTEPQIEPSALERWKEQMVQEIERRRTSVEAQLVERSWALRTGDDPRVAFLSRQQIDRLTLQQGQRWLEGMIARAPIEVAVVGDIPRERALELTLKYLGSLPPRSREDEALEALRVVEPRPDLDATVEVATITPRARVLAGWLGADWTDVKDRRILQIAAQILTTRLREEIREERGLTYSPWCDARAAQAYPGTGLFVAYFSADPGRAAEAADAAREVIQDFADEGPTEQEMAAVRKQFANIIEVSQREPGYWASVLSDLDYRGTVLADVKTAMEAYTSYTVEDMMDVLGRYVVPERRIQVVAVPVSPAGAEPAPVEPREEVTVPVD